MEKYTFTAHGLGQTNITISNHICINHWIEMNLTFLVLPFRYFRGIV